MYIFMWKERTPIPKLNSFLVVSFLDFLKFLTRRWYGGGYSTLRFNLENVIWWRQFSFKEGWVPQSIIYLGWSVKIKSIQDVDWGNIWVASEINCLKPCVVVKGSFRVPLMLVMFFDHHVDDLALKSPRITANWDFQKKNAAEHVFKTRKERFKCNTDLTRRPIHCSNISFLVLICYLTN